MKGVGAARVGSPWIPVVFLSAALLCGFSIPGTAAVQWPSDEWLSDPVDDPTFRTFLDFFAYDADLPLEVEPLDSTTSDGIRREQLTFQSTPGVRVFARFYRPEAGDWQNRPTIVFLHGGAASGMEYLTPVALRMVRGGLNVFGFDLQYFGRRKTDLLQNFTEEEKHARLYNQPSTYLAWVAQTVKDAGRSFDLLVQERGIPPERIGLMGRSRGAQLGTIVAGADDRFRAVVLAYGGHFDAAETGHLAAACPANYIGRISPRPLLLINGIHDSDYDREKSVLPLHRLAREPVEALWADTGHQISTPEHLAALIAFFRRHLE